MLAPNNIPDTERSNVERRDRDAAFEAPRQRKIIHIDMDGAP